MSGSADDLDNDEVASYAIRWLSLLRHDDFGNLWAALHGDFRLALSQLWILNGENTGADLDFDGLATAMATEWPVHPQWPQAQEFLRSWFARSIAWAGSDDLRSGTRTRVIAPGLELVRFFPVSQLHRDSDGGLSMLPGSVLPTYNILMSYSSQGWLVIGIGDGVIEPGWPPTFKRLVEAAD